jgi:hypothetical protein
MLQHTKARSPTKYSILLKNLISVIGEVVLYDCHNIKEGTFVTAISS